MRLKPSLIVILLSVASVLNAGSVTTFSSGFVVPESIAVAPSVFGLSAGSLVVVDYGAGTIDSVSANGGSPAVLATATLPVGVSTGAIHLVNGVFTPYAGFLADGYTYSQTGAPVGVIFQMPNAAHPGVGLVIARPNSAFLGSAVVPTAFGSVSGDTLIVETGSQNAILALSPLVGAPLLLPFATLSSAGGDLAFAPAGFVAGTTSPVLLVSDEFDGNIYWIDNSGHEHLFATVPLTAGQTGLRDLAFAPAGFETGSANYSGDLFVSVSGSIAGGGTFGSVDVLNSSGSLVAVLTQGSVDAPFDPRGLDFTGPDQLLIANADPSILSATPASFAPVPEPSAFGAVGVVLGVIIFLRRREVRRFPCA